MKSVKRGFAAAKEVQVQRAASGRRDTPELFLRPDETVPACFNGAPTEPVLVWIHVIKFTRKNGAPGYETAYCGMEEHGECEGCDRNAAGDKRVGARMASGAFSVVDLRWFGKTEGKEYQGKMQYYYDALPMDVADPFEPAPRKVRYRDKLYTEIVRRPSSQLFLLSNPRCLQLGAEQSDIGRRCKNCGKGKISIDGYKVGKKTVPELEEDQEGTPIYTCAKCDDPEPWSIFSLVPTIIKRVGTDKPVYSFKVDQAQDMDAMEWVNDLEPVDLEVACAPTGKGRYEVLLGGGKYKAAKPEKEVEDDDDESSDDEEDSLYDKSAAKKPAKKKLVLKKASGRG